MALPLDGIKVLDLCRLLPGPYATQILADYGAEVIRIEDPNSVDLLRLMPPVRDGRGVLFQSINRGKKSVSIDLKSEPGKEIFRRMVKDADIVIEGFRPGVMNRLGLGYECLREINRRLIYCSITGYGNTGPYRDRVGHDLNYISYAGLAGLTGPSDGKPFIPGVQVADIGGGGLWAVISVLLALQARSITGEGQSCDLSMTDGVFSWMPFYLAGTVMAGSSPRRGAEVLNGGYACYNIYETGDGKYVSIGAIEPKFWAQFCSRLGLQDFIDRQYLPEAQPAMIEELGSLLREKTRDEWVAWFDNDEVCFSPVLDYDEAILNEQLVSRQMIAEVEIGDQKARVLCSPVKMSATPARVCQELPEAGADTKRILREIGFSEEYIEELRAKGII